MKREDFDHDEDNHDDESEGGDGDVKPKKKPTVEVDICCPNCRASVHVRAYKHRISEPVKPEYRVTAEVELGTQMSLPGMQPQAKATAQADPPAPPAASGKPERDPLCRPHPKKKPQRRAAAH